MFKVLVLRTLSALSDDQTEGKLLDLALQRFDAALHPKDDPAMGVQIVATLGEARRTRLRQPEKDPSRCDGTPEDWRHALKRQIDRDCDWTLRRGRKREWPPAGYSRVSTCRQNHQARHLFEMAGLVLVAGTRNHRELPDLTTLI